MENTKPGDTNVCIICTQRKRGKRMKELYKDCIHDSFICEDCKFLHEQMKRAKKSTNPKVCPLCYLLRFAIEICVQSCPFLLNEKYLIFYNFFNCFIATTGPIISSGTCTVLVITQTQCTR